MEENVNGYEKCKNRSESRPNMGNSRCGNNLSLLKLVLGEELQNDDTWDNMLALWKDTLVLDYYHPAVHYPNRVNYYALMAICDVARKKYGTPVWSEQNEKY